MALKECKECGGQVSTKADVCPHCGAKKTESLGYALAPVFLVLLLYFFWEEILRLYFWWLSNMFSKILEIMFGK